MAYFNLNALSPILTQRTNAALKAVKALTFVCLTAGTKLVLLVAGSAFPRWPLPAADGVQRVLDGSTLALTTAPALADRESEGDR